ncbi:MAG: M20/M25/M40 family metallo-hydrolase [Myxococcales bacterium]|nr:M20/M25/M40 family metallo-hydrolase [Myxococcales bacterium]
MSTATPPRAWRELRPVLWALAALAAVLWLSSARFAPPAPLGLDAPPERFSAGRAARILAEVLGDGAPHPVGSAAHAAVRDRITATLRTLGYAPELQTSFVCGGYGACAPVENVVAVLEGREPGEAIVLAAHYDSVPAGPGASDDGAGVAAVLEIARALRALPQPRRSILLLHDDAEEDGLLGATAFVREHPRARDVRAVVNLEARGTSGPSLMFETGHDDAGLVALYAAAAERPLTSSLFRAVYDRLPNDTDLSVWKRHGYTGLNFAFVGDVVHYHTPADDLAHLDRGSLQHHGDNGLAAVRALADGDWDTHGGDGVYFDVLGWLVVRWPLGATLPLAALALALAAAMIGLALRTRQLRSWRGFAGGALATLAAPVLAAAAGYAVVWALRAVAPTDVPWYGTPAPAYLCLAGGAALGVALLAQGLGRGAGLWSNFVAHWTVWAVLATVAASLVPAASFPLLVPALVAGVTGVAALLLRVAPGRVALALALVPAVVAWILWLPIAIGTAQALGVEARGVLGAALGLCLAPLVPVLALPAGRLRHAPAWVAAAALVLPVVVVAFLATGPRFPFTENHPQRLSVSHLEREGSGEASWFVDASWDALPPDVGLAAGIGALGPAPLPYLGYRTVGRAPAPPLGTPGPVLEVRARAPAGAVTRVEARLRSQRGASTIGLIVPHGGGIVGVAFRGQRAVGRDLRGSPWWGRHALYTCLGVPPEGVEVAFDVESGRSLELDLVDVTSGLPPEADAILEARGPFGTPSQDGDLTLVVRAAALAPP